MDNVEKVIVKNKEFWQLFKDEESCPSYKKYIDCFCLNCLTELENNAEYKVFFSKEWKEGNWEVYQRLLDSFVNKRRKEMKERIKIVGI